MKKILIYFSLIVFAIGGCKKVDLDEVLSGGPVFKVTADFANGTALNLVAGDDDFYMFSEFSKDNFDVITMTGRFAKDSNCDVECEESLSFSIRSSYAAPSVSDFIFENAVLSNDSLPFFTNNNSTSIGYNYFFTAEYIDIFSVSQADSFYWEITGDNPLDNSSFESFSLVYLGQTDLTVRLEITSSGGCTSYIQKTIPLGVLDDCDLYINAVQSDSLEFTLLPILGNGSGATFDWINIGDDTLTIDSTTSIPLNGIFELVALSNNNQCFVEIGICPEFQNTNAFPSSFSFPKINYSVDTFLVNNPMDQLSAVTIEYQDSTGIYSSKFADNSNNTFTITKIENYEDNENGEKTKKLTIEYDCILKEDGSGEEKNISGTAEIAVAYPN